MIRRASLLASFLCGCVPVEAPETGVVTSPGMLNGMLNGLQHPEGLDAYLAAQCPALHARLLRDGNLDRDADLDLAVDLATPTCERFLYYTVELMLPYGQSLVLANLTFQGAMGLERVVSRAYPGYAFLRDGFLPAFPVARKVVTQGYAALTNGIERVVSYKTGHDELDEHRGPTEDAWPREFTQLVPFTDQALAAMTEDPGFLGRLPDFFNACSWHLINYDYLTSGCGGKVASIVAGATAKTCSDDTALAPFGSCPVPIVVRGDLDFVDEVVPGRSCRIRKQGEELPPGTILNGDVIIPEGGCPLIFYAGRVPGQTVYDDRARNGAFVTDGCDVVGPSQLASCNFDVVDQGAAIPDAFLEYFVFNVAPL